MAEADTAQEYFAFNTQAFPRVLAHVISHFRGDDFEEPDVRKKALILQFAEVLKRLSQRVFEMFAAIQMPVPIRRDGTPVADGRSYFLYLSEDPAHGYAASGSSGMEAWMVLSAIGQGLLAGPALRPNDSALDGQAFGPIERDALAQRLVPTLRSMTTQHLVLRRGANAVIINLDVKMFTLANSIDTIVQNLIAKSHTDGEVLLVCDVYKLYVERHPDAGRINMDNVLWCSPIHYEFLRNLQRGIIQ